VQKNPRILDIFCRGPTGSCTIQARKGSAYAQSGKPDRGEPSHCVRPHARLQRRADGPSAPVRGCSEGEQRRESDSRRAHLT